MLLLRNSYTCSKVTFLAYGLLNKSSVTQTNRSLKSIPSGLRLGKQILQFYFTSIQLPFYFQHTHLGPYAWTFLAHSFLLKQFQRSYCGAVLSSVLFSCFEILNFSLFLLKHKPSPNQKIRNKCFSVSL